MKKINVKVQGLFSGTFRATSVVIAHEHRLVFVKDETGNVFVTRRDGVDLSREGICNDKVRRAYAQLAGIKFSDLKAAIAVQREANKRERNADQLDQARRLARNLGYRLTKIK